MVGIGNVVNQTTFNLASTFGYHRSCLGAITLLLFKKVCDS